MGLYRHETAGSEALQDAHDLGGCEYDAPSMKDIDSALSALRWVAFAAPLIALWVAGFWDLVHRKDLTVKRKAVWAALFIFTAYIGLAFYFAMRPVRPPAGKGNSATVPRASGIVTELESLSVERNAGEITEDAFVVRKRELLGL
jgi:hypothetical protein